MRYVKLNKTERETLEFAYKNHLKFHVRKRSQSLLLSNNRVKVSVIAKVMKVRTRTIYAWMDRWEKMGIAGIMITAGRGRKPSLSIANNDLISMVKKK